MKKCFGLSIVMMITIACATQPLLKDHKPKNSDEEKIINLMLKFEQGYSQQDPEKILQTYAQGAMIKTIVDKKDWSGVMLPKNEHAAVLYKQVDFYKRIKIKLKIHQPREIIIKDNEASMTGTYEVSATDPYAPDPYKSFYEKGICYLDFIRTDSRWLISKRTWEVIECNDPDFMQWKKKQK
jgi:hypothetical protein